MSDKSIRLVTGTGNVDMTELQGLTLEEQKTILEAETKLAITMLPISLSKDLIGQKINILDAVFSTIPDEGELKQVVVFAVDIVETNEIVAVTKSSNSFSDAYVGRFDAWRGKANKPINNMMFAIDEKYTKKGNPAVVLRAYKPAENASEPQEKSVAKAK